MAFKCITAFGHRVALCSPIWLKESEPAGMMRGFVMSEDIVFLITTFKKTIKLTPLNQWHSNTYNYLFLFEIL